MKLCCLIVSSSLLLACSAPVEEARDGGTTPTPDLTTQALDLTTQDLSTPTSDLSAPDLSTSMPDMKTVATPAGSVDTPTFGLAAGTYTGLQQVGIYCATKGATLYYTTNGTTPTTSSSLYTGEHIHVPHTETISAIGVLAGKADSAVGSARYTIE